ncbi:MAG: putative ABC transport system permease protein [Marinoscillum sp.]|jgi:putative ABC transport system permease protein
MNNQPPRLPLRFLSWFCNPRLLTYIEGDLLELFHERAAESGQRRAKWLFFWEVVKLFRPSIIRSFGGTYRMNQCDMFRNNLKIGWRNLLRNKGFFAINTGGLAIGIATCLVIMLFVSDELSYDTYNEKANQIVRVVLKGKMGDEIIKEAVTQAPVGATLQREFPEVLLSARIRDFGTPKASYQNNTFRDGRFACVDHDFFSLFTLPLIKGNPATALKEPNTIVITRAQASKYFGEEDPLGKVLDFEEWNEHLTVTGVIEEVPQNSHFHFDFFASMEGLPHAKEPRWLESNYHTYLLLDKGYDYKELEPKLPAIVEKYMGPQLMESMGMSLKSFNEKGNHIGLFLQPLTDIHLFSDFSSYSELEPGGDIKSIYIFGAIALFMLLVACINFMNLSTASASKRAKEVGIRKVLGSAKRQLLIQFLTESFMATLTAMLLSVVIVLVSLPLFNNLSGKALQVTDILTVQNVLYFALFGIAISLLSGSYPAFVLSSFKPILALKSKFITAGGKGMRSGLVVFQFVVTVVLIIATLMVDQQMSFIQNKEIGYDKDQVIVIRESGLLGNKQTAFKELLLNDSRVENITMSGHIPAGPSNISMTSVSPGPESVDFRRTPIYYIDDQYIPTMGMELVAGRNFSTEYGSESQNVIVNETFLKIFGLEKDALGKTIKMQTDNEGGTENGVIIGVIKDFHFRPLHQSIEPLVMMNHPNSGLIVRAITLDMPALVADMESMWNDFNIGEPFSYSLLDELYNRTYLKEQKMGKLLRIFALLTIFVASLGLFGLTIFTAEQRVKEMGIRKILGSSVGQIITLLSFNFLKLVLISFLIAFPLGYYLMTNWLQDFAYRMDFQWWIFPLSGFLTILIAFMTISFKSIKVAFANPVDALRDE